MYGGTAEFDALAFGEPHMGTVNFLRSEHQALMANANQFVGDLGRQFVSTAQRLYQTYISDSALQHVRNILRNVSTTTEAVTSHVQHLIDLMQLRQANMTTQRYLMANPEIRKAYHHQRVDGYSDTYVDVEPDAVGDSHRDYRLVMDGMPVFQYDEEGEVEGYEISYYYLETELGEDERDLDVGEQVDILSMWDLMSHYYHKGEDPTDALAASK